MTTFVEWYLGVWVHGVKVWSIVWNVIWCSVMEGVDCGVKCWVAGILECSVECDMVWSDWGCEVWCKMLSGLCFGVQCRVVDINKVEVWSEVHTVWCSAEQRVVRSNESKEHNSFLNLCIFTKISHHLTMWINEGRVLWRYSELSKFSELNKGTYVYLNYLLVYYI